MKTKWENSSWGKKLVVQKRRASLNDFDRFKVMLAKIKVRHFTHYHLVYWFRALLFSPAYPVIFHMNRGVVLSGKSLPSSRRRLQLRIS